MPSPLAVNNELDRILSSKTFVNSPQLCRFLKFIVEYEIAGRGGELKEYVLGLQVLRKDDSFDPRLDTGVRSEARRLRQKLAEYYHSEGQGDPIEITLPKGSYRPAFHGRPEKAAARPPRAWVFGIAGCGVLALTIGAWLWTRAHATARVPSVAVLPFENLSADPDQEYFSDGLTDALFTNLAKIRALSVISRTSVMQYKGTKKPVPEIARELKVDYVVEGTVIRAGDRVRISAQLIAASTDRHVWAESYDRAGSDGVSLQSELAQTIASQIHVQVTPQEQRRLIARPVGVEAQELYLKGRFNWQTRDTGRMQKSIEYFNEALIREPRYAMAYAGLADAYSVLSYRLGRKEFLTQACAAARKAIELDDGLGDAHASMDACEYQWDWRARERHLQRAIELNPSDSTAHQWYGALLINTGRGAEGLAEVRRSVELDPLAPAPNNALCMSLFFVREYDRAIQHCQQIHEVFPDYIEPYYGLGFTYAQKGMYPEAIGILQKAMKLSGGAPEVASILAHARALSGDRNAVPQLLREYQGRTDVSPAILAALYVDARDKHNAFYWLETAVEKHSFASESIKVHPALDGLHSDARWSALLRKMNLQD